MDAVVEVLRVADLVVLVALAAVSFRYWRRAGGGSARWMALSFGILAVVDAAFLAIPDSATGPVATAARRVTSAAVALFPYFLFRFAASFSATARPLNWLAAALTSLVAVAALILPPTLLRAGGGPALVYLSLLLVQWALLSLIVASRLWRAGRGQPTVARRRMRLLSVAATGLVVTLLLAPLAAGGTVVTDALLRSGVLASAGLFFVGFAPPAWLRSLWRNHEQEHVRAAVMQLMSAETQDDVTASVLGPIARIVGARAVALIDDRGRLLGSHGDLRGLPAAPDAPGDALGDAGMADEERRDYELVHLRFAFGSLLVWTSPYAPFFGEEEFATLQSLGALVEIALDRCRLLAQERRAREALQRSDEVKNTFLSAVSHELRTPLTGILGYAVLLESAGATLAPEKSQAILRIIAEQARKLQRLLSDLLDIDRLTRGNLRPQLRPTDMAALVRRVAADVDLEGRRLEIDDADVIAMVDGSKVERVVENLLMNAVRHTPEGTRVWLRLSRADGGVRIVVEDEGPGVPEELKGSIFEPFRQGASSAGHSRGTGIGLSLVARLAELHGGDASVGDRAGGGAAFVVNLPDCEVRDRDGAAGDRLGQVKRPEA